ncbi:pathogen-associated molecular patterns-induced protein A70-like [Rhodamnia argentea]|uniref:Pathogen-associated molecular patterns-induced protein A70-like n=1 Tax=Rhodamnia argentea TaxID=178133 RepID=A0A8B8P7Q1_9MYRT|nr:pathogen-associated molecular patterns-induced protein A70-like [Rhodamnia argentea]
MWAFMEGWFTPSSLFIFLNLVIGTIVLTSRLGFPRQQPPHHHLGSSSDSPPLARAPSLLDRVRSIDFSLYKFGHPAGGYPEPDAVHYEHSYPEHDFARRAESPPLARAPSLLDRLKSIDFSLYKFDHPAGYPEQDPVPVQGSYPEPQSSHPVESPPLARAPSLVDRLKSFDFDFAFYKFQAPSYAQPQADHDEHSSEQEYADRVEPPRLARTPSLLERLKSINFSSFNRSSEPDPDADALHHLGVDSDSEDDDDDSVPYADADRAPQDHLVRRIRSDSKIASPGEATARLPAKMKKSASERSAFGHFEEDDFVERRRTETAREGKKKSGAAAAAPFEEEGHEIDAKADAFINRFKQHLKLQRLDSLLNYREMLNRGAS